MKQVLFLSVCALFSISIHAQSVKAKLGAGGSFLILDDGAGTVPDPELVKFRILETGEVNWFLDGEQMYIRESNFEYETGKFGTYDHFFVDGTNGRLGINVLSNATDPADNNLPLTSSVNLYGSIATRIRILNGSNNYAIRQDDHIMIVDKQDGGDSDMILPNVITSKGRELHIKRNGFNDGKIIVKPQSGQQLNGVVDGSISLGVDNASVMIVCAENSWWVLTQIAPKATVVTISSTTTLSNEDFVEVNFTSANQVVDVKLPAAANYDGKRYEIKRNANNTTFAGNIVRVIPQSTGAEQLDQYTNANPYLMTTDFESVTVESNGTKWLIVSDYNQRYEKVDFLASTTSTLTEDQSTIVGVNSTVTLPDPATMIGKVFTLKAGTVGKLTINPNGSDVIDGSNASIVLNTLDVIKIEAIAPGNWVIVGKNKDQNVTPVSSAYAPVQNDDFILADATSSTFNVTLPLAAIAGSGKEYTIKRTNSGSNFVNITTQASETIDGLSELRLNQVFDYLSVVSDGSNWLIKSERISAVFVTNPASPYNITPYDETVSGNAAGTFNLPSVSSVLIGKKITIKNTATAANPSITVAPDGSESIEGGVGGASITLAKGDAVTLQSDGTGWFIISFFSLP